jgi:cobalt-zinc-cadmium efflux system outer membrane protein
MKMERLLLWVATLPALMAGCALAPTLELLPQARRSLPVTERPVMATTVAAVSLISPAASPRHERSIDRLTLPQALELAERVHPDFTAAQAQVESAEGRALQAGLFPNPELVSRIESVPVTGRIIERAEYIVGVSQPAPLGQRLAVARRVETLDRDRLGLKLEVKRLEIRRLVQSAFATVLYGQRVIQARAEDVQIAENGVAVAKARLAAGDAIPAEVGQAEVELGRARLELEQATSRRAQAIEALVTAIGDLTLHVESLEGSLEGPLALPTLEALATRLEQSPVIAAVEADIAVQRARIDLADTQRIPDVSFELLYRRVGDVENTVDVGLRVPIPLFNRYQGSIREARADFVAAEAQARSTRNELELELRTSYRTLARAIAAAQLLREEILPRAESVLRSAETRYASGDISLAELLPIRRDWTRARLDYLEALNEVTQAWAALSPYLY